MASVVRLIVVLEYLVYASASEKLKSDKRVMSLDFETKVMWMPLGLVKALTKRASDLMPHCSSTTLSELISHT